MKLLKSTLKRLSSQARGHAQQIILINRIAEAIAKEDVEFEVHFQSQWNDHKPVTVRGDKLGRTFERAVKRWDELNGKSRMPSHGPAIVFVRARGLLCPIRHHEVVAIIKNENGGEYSLDQFAFDGRLAEPVGKVVWRTNEKLPGLHAK